MPITELPFGLKGHVYGSRMPSLGADDPTYQEMKSAGVDVVVVLAEAKEWLHLPGPDLLDLYRSEGWEVIHCPIRDFCAPTVPQLECLVRQIAGRAREGKNVVIHCMGGRGRTGMVMAALAKHVLDPPPAEPIAWVRQFIDGAVETCEQKEAVKQAFAGPSEAHQWPRRALGSALPKLAISARLPTWRRQRGDAGGM